jgi:hypothetical protein
MPPPLGWRCYRRASCRCVAHSGHQRYRYRSTPTRRHRAGTLLGDRKINIASFALGRNPQTRQATGFVNVDDRVPDEVLKETRAIPAVRTARVVKV